MQYGPPPYYNQPYRQGPDPEPPKPGCLMPAIWLGATILITLICAVVVGGMASQSETDGVQATQIASIPFGFVWGGLVSAAILQFGWKKASPGMRAGGPLGCGCLGAIVMAGLVVVFFTAIFPSL